MSDIILQLDAVGVHFGGLKAVDGVSLGVRRGGRHAVIGPNGDRKSVV